MELNRKLFSTPTDTPRRKPEWKLQAASVSALHKLQDEGWQFLIAGDAAGVKMTPSQAHMAKLTGCMEGGEPDLAIYAPGPTAGFIEYKADGGRLSAAQIARHGLLEAWGFRVVVVKADNENDAVEASVAFVKELVKPPRTLH